MDDFVQCWTCKHCFFDMLWNKYACNHGEHINKRMFKFEACKLTDCKHWERG